MPELRDFRDGMNNISSMRIVKYTLMRSGQNFKMKFIHIILLIIIFSAISCDDLIDEGIDNQNKKYTITKILFASDREGNWELYTMNPDGSDQKRLLYSPSSLEQYCSWSPDGRYIVFGSDLNTPGTSQIFIMKEDGTGIKALTNYTAGANQPVWSPDGSKIAFISSKDGTNDIYVMDNDGTNVRRLSNDATMEYGVSWRSDSKSIIFDKTSIGIASINIDGSNYYVIPNSSGCTYPTFSPDDNYIYSQYNSGGWHIFKMPSNDGISMQNLTSSQTGNACGNVILSPDGNEMYYAQNISSNYQIFRWIDTSTCIQLTTTGSNYYMSYKIR